MKYPCEKCVCIAICRHKEYKPLVENCILIRSALYYEGRRSQRDDRYSQFAKQITMAEEILKPITWHTATHEDSGRTYVREVITEDELVAMGHKWNTGWEQVTK